MKEADGIKIFETLEEIADPAHSCLVVWDVQNLLVERIFNRDEFLGSLARLLGGLRKKMPVVYTLITPPPSRFRSSFQIYSMMKRYHIKEPSQMPAFMPPGSKEREVPESVKPEEGDIVIDKPSASIFIGTNFEYMMRARGITTLLFTGIATEYGVESSARDAANRGFYPVVVSDCVSSMDKEAHERSLKNMQNLVIVSSTDELLKSVR